MSVVEQFPYYDRNPASPGLDLMPDLPLLLRRQSHALSSVGLVDSGASISVLPYALGIQLGFDWHAETTRVSLAGTLAHVEARGIVVEAVVGKLPPARLAFAWAKSDQVPLLLGQFNFFQAFDVCFLRGRGLFRIGPSGTVSVP
jgi:hypothetical protein